MLGVGRLSPPGAPRFALPNPSAPLLEGESGEGRTVPRINVDVTLRAALMNLFNNAADASPRAIEIYTRRDDSSFILEIHDHGAGLSAEAALKAGSAFFSTKTAGRGLGLFLANATIERMGGTVRLFNREQGGATTVLTLPIISRALK